MSVMDSRFMYSSCNFFNDVIMLSTADVVISLLMVRASH
jgi:hypothetical protein